MKGWQRAAEGWAPGRMTGGQEATAQALRRGTQTRQQTTPRPTPPPPHERVRTLSSDFSELTSAKLGGYGAAPPWSPSCHPQFVPHVARGPLLLPFSL